MTHRSLETYRRLDTATIMERLEHLERQNRGLKRALVLGFVLLGCFALMGASKKGRSVQATEFLLKDNEGQTRASLRMGSAGPGLAFYDANGKAVRALLGVLPAGPALGLYDPDGKNRISLGISAKGANLTFNDSDEKLRSELGMLEEGPNLLFLDHDGKTVYKVR
jgi:hypothetical protein